MAPTSKRTTTPHPIAFRLPEIARQQLDELMSRWGENQSQVIIRCIERVWMSEKSHVPIYVQRVNPYGSSIFSQEMKEMDMFPKKQLASLLSIDRNIEVALYPAGIEVRVSAAMKEELEAAIELEKTSSWLPVWGQIKGFIMSNVSKIVLKLTKFSSISLEDVNGIEVKDSKLRILRNKENILETVHMYGKVGQYEINLKPGESNVFNPDDVIIFTKRVEEVKPLYLNYLKSIGASSS